MRFIINNLMYLPIVFSPLVFYGAYKYVKETHRKSNHSYSLIKHEIRHAKLIKSINKRVNL